MSKKQKMAEFADDLYKIHVTGRHVQVTDAMKDYAIDKVQKIERFTERLIDVTITMDIQKLDHKVDITIRANHVKIKSHAISTDMYASIDKAVDRIEKQLKKYMSRLHDYQNRQLRAEEVLVDVLIPWDEDEEIFEINQQLDEQEEARLEMYKPHRVVHKEMRPLKSLSMDEAVMKMELSQDAFLVFRSEQNSRLQVIYRRKDGNYGVIQPEG